MSAETRNQDAVTAVLLEAIGVLEQESDVLAGRSAALLADVAMRKARWIGQMADTLRTLSPADRAAPMALAARARELNDRNARLLAARVVSNRARLDVLTGAAMATYGAGGRTSSAARSTRSFVA